jgi:TolB-like protein
MIAVIPFTTSGTGVELLGEGMVDLLSTNLNAVGGISTVDPRNVLSRWKKQGGTAKDDALEVGRSLDAGSVLMGSVIAAGPSVRINAELTSVTGEALARAQVNGSSENLIALVDSLSLALLRDIWRSREPLPSVHVGAITTNSVDAIRAFLAGEKAYREARWDTAISYFTRSVELDSTFALANFRLALANGWTGGWQTPRSIAATQAAVRFATRLPERDRSLLAGYNLFTQARLEAVDSMRQYLRSYPRDPDGWFMLADAQFHMNPLLGLSPAELRAPFDSVIKLDPSLLPAYFHPVETAMIRRDRMAYTRYVETLDSVVPPAEAAQFKAAGRAVWGDSVEQDSAFAALAGAQVGLINSAVFSQYYAEEPDFRRMTGALQTGSQRLQPPNPRASADAMMGRAMVMIGLGRLEQARLLTDTIMELSQDLGFAATLQPVVAGLVPATERRELIERFRRAPIKDPFMAMTRAVLELTQGEPAAARRVLDEGLRLEGDRVPPPIKAMLRGYRAWADIMSGDTAGGLVRIEQELKQAGTWGINWASTNLRFRYAELLASRPATREKGINLLLNTFSGGQDVLFLPLTFLLAGRALEDAGRRQEAAQAYGQFLRLWKEADPSMQSRVDEAREGLKRVTAEGS